MSFNNAKEKTKWIARAKEKENEENWEENCTREQIEILRELSHEEYKSERRFREHETPMDEEGLEYYAEKISEVRNRTGCPEIRTVQDLLDVISDPHLYYVLKSADPVSQEFVLLKFKGYSNRDIARMKNNTTDKAVSKRLRRLSERLKTIKDRRT